MRAYVPPVLFVCVSIATLFVWSLAWGAVPSGVLTVSFLDVGQGDAIYIETPHGNRVLLDGGKGKAVLRELGSHLGTHDRTIDVVLASHPDLDHIGGLPEVFERYEVVTFLEPGVTDDGADNAALHAAVTREGIPILHARKGMTLLLDEGVYLSFLFPESDVSAFEANTGSIVARLTYGDTSFLFTGDAPQAVERHLVSSYGIGLQSDVLKLGHHGSDTSTSPEFLAAVLPTYAVVSAGCDNSYGHPHEAVLDRVRSVGSTILGTCTHGRVSFESDGREIVVGK